MNTKNTNKVNMVDTVITYCDTNAAVTAGMTAFADTLNAVKVKVGLINSLNAIAGGTTKGVTLDTKDLRKEMQDLALKCANATVAFASKTENNTLFALVNVTESGLKKEKKEDVDDVCERIKNATNANIASLGTYGIVAGDITNLDAAIQIYRSNSQNPRQAAITKSQATRQVTVMIGEIVGDLLGKQLDKLAATFKTSNLEFVNGYEQARLIIDLGSTTAKVRGTVKNENDVPLVGVVFKMKQLNEVKKSVNTDVKGKYSVGDFAAGIYDLVWEFDGYTAVTEKEVKIAAGKEITKNVVMK